MRFKQTVNSFQMQYRSEKLSLLDLFLDDYRQGTYPSKKNVHCVVRFKVYLVFDCLLFVYPLFVVSIWFVISTICYV